MGLEEKLKEVFENVEKGIMNPEVFYFHDSKSKFTNLTPRVVVEVEFTDGKTAKIDVTEYFKEVVK